MAIQEFSRLLLEELNYIQEARNAEQFSKNFTGDQRIVVPKVIWEYTTPHILALEYVEGIKINNVEALRSQGIKTKEIAQLLVESYMRQILLHRFFHGDPHPGNLFVQPGPRLVFVDFGLMQRITPSVDKAIKQTMTAIIQRETEGIIQGLMDLGFIVRTDNPADLEQVTTYFMDKYREMSPKEFREITVADVAEDLSKLLRIYPFLQIPNTFILFARAAGMLNGLNATLDPDLNIVDLAKPFAQQYIGEERGWLETALIQGKEWGATLFDLPQQLEEFLKLARRGEFKTRMSSEDVTGILTRFYKLALRLTLGLFAAFLLFLPKPLQEAIPPFLHSLSGLVGILILVAILWSLLRELLKTP
jgi:ubiquinone biosynthesis protein